MPRPLPSPAVISVSLAVAVVLGGALMSALPVAAQPAAANPVPPAPPPVPPPTGGAVDDQTRIAKATALADEVAKVRGLKRKKPITSGVMSQDQIRARLVERIDQEYAPDELEGEAIALKRMGLLPRDADYKQLVLDLLTEQIAGFYDPETAELYLAGWTSAPAGSGTGGMQEDLLIAHEIDHALQDQNFGLAKFMKADKHNGDASAARLALVEGDATALMIELSLAQLGMADTASLWSDDQTVAQMATQLDSAMATSLSGASLAKAPLVLREGLLFPYLAGFRFVVSLRRTQPWSAVDAVFRKPPLSTEHILDPASYAAYDKPVVVKLATPAALAKARLVYQNVSGQAGFAVLLRQHGVAQARADAAAMGWGGDRLMVWAPAESTTLGRVVAVSRSVWDQEADAIEMFDALSDATRSLARGERTRSEVTLVEQTTLLGRRTVLERRGAELVLIVNAPADTADAILAAAWK